jgi:hypothetical protein
MTPPKSPLNFRQYSNDKKLGIRFETKDGKITRYYAGTERALALVEGCG